jgi:hypothetical protein
MVEMLPSTTNLAFMVWTAALNRGAGVEMLPMLNQSGIHAIDQGSK